MILVILIHSCFQNTVSAAVFIFQEPQKMGLFINIFDWVRVPEPKSDADPIPVMGGPMYDGRDDSGKIKN